jgi:hypothetical protein
MFFVSYCRSLTASSLHTTISEDVRDVTGIQVRAAGRDYARVVQILHLCPERPDDRSRLQIVGVYYSFLNLLDRGFARIFPSVREWAEEERAGCAHFAAVALGRRIALNREMLAQQVEL